MTYFSDLQAAGRNASPRVYYFVIVCLVSYILLDFALHHNGNSECADLVFDAAKMRSGHISEFPHEPEEAICKTLIGHLNSGPKLPVAKAWNQMKWIGSPARCRVKGHLIESLDDSYNFRRGFALRFVGDVEDKTMVLPWMYGSKVNLNKRARRVYLDLGANAFETSVQWFSRMYPCDFTEVHAFEVSPGLFRVPDPGFNEESNWAAENSHSVRVKEVAKVPDWMVKRIKVYNTFVSDADGDTSVNITRFMKEELKLKKEDAVVVKMDIEEAEWPILERWLQDPAMPEIIDELFVEIHYHHNTMLDFHWGHFSHSREEALRLMAGMRAKGFFIHAWP